MSEQVNSGAFGVLIEPATLKIERLLSGPPERVWAYLTQSDLRRRWLASGDMDTTVGSTVDLVWRNDELTNPPGSRPDGFGDEHRMQSRILEALPPRRLIITWGVQGEVSFDLAARGEKTLLTLIHRRLSDRANLLNVGAGWHAHLDVLEGDLAGVAPPPFWDSWVALRAEYESRLPA
jgi:uncharacterized protein YndB with AHSA1/START domain